MKTSIVCILLFGAALVNARPQGRGGEVTVECTRKEVAPGKFAFSCDQLGRGQEDSLTLKSEHVLWIQQDGAAAQEIDVQVPNYRIDELIKAGFKGAAGGDTRVNILLKKPEQTYNAEVDRPESVASAPSVGVSYEPVEKILVHYPNDKPYQPLSGPILPPA